jgi:uncharacterized protein with HEPN domain
MPWRQFDAKDSKQHMQWILLPLSESGRRKSQTGASRIVAAWCTENQGSPMLTGAMLALMRQIGLDIIVLTEEVNETEFFASRLTRTETLRLLQSMTKTAAGLPVDTRQRMPDIDWEAWIAMEKVLKNPVQHPLQLWVAIKELTPLTLQKLNGYKKCQPQLFSVVP